VTLTTTINLQQLGLAASAPYTSVTTISTSPMALATSGGASATVVGVTTIQLTNVSTAGGLMGPAGPGLPTGGYQGQVLVKSSTVNFDTEWTSAIDAGEFI